MKRYLESLAFLEDMLTESRSNFLRRSSWRRQNFGRFCHQFFSMEEVFLELMEKGEVAQEMTYPNIMLLVAFRKILCSMTLIESGFPSESKGVLRSSVEALALSLDLSTNAESLQEFVRITSGNYTARDHRRYRHRFNFPKVIKRLRKRLETREFSYNETADVKILEEAYENLSKEHLHINPISIESLLTKKRKEDVRFLIVDTSYTKSEKRLNNDIWNLKKVLRFINIRGFMYIYFGGDTTPEQRRSIDLRYRFKLFREEDKWWNVPFDKDRWFKERT